jgi:hypothetical protein
LKNETFCLEADQFNTSRLLPKYIKTAKRLRDYGLRVDDEIATAIAVVNACQQEYVINKTESPWCKLLDNDVFKQYEMLIDIVYHCKFGYKYEITKMMTCDLIKELKGRLSDIKNR